MMKQASDSGRVYIHAVIPYYPICPLTYVVVLFALARHTHFHIDGGGAGSSRESDASGGSPEDL
ncbi:hypothetical protein M419DRAFT_13163 [Trichoderma reesei RUT C-30]|nr:hypothetical protein M419DRAFT_13163 [Trichoderma reesei RUT C-30]